MQEQYHTILLQYISEGAESELEMAYELGRRAISEEVSLLQLVEIHYKALADVLQGAKTTEESNTIVQRAAILLKEALGPFEMTTMGYKDTISALRKQNEKLEKLMEERSRLLQEREDFMMVVTHDLKTPITAADRCLGLFLEGDFGEVSSTQIEVLSTLKDSNRQMFSMVKNLLEISKYEQATSLLHPKKVNLVQLIQSLAKSLTLSAQTRGLTLNVEFADDLQEVMADENALQHVLTNLVDNALKFTPAKGTITISAYNSGPNVLIEVKDTGKGIEKDDLPKLFQRFFQSEGGRKQYTGTGLGLYLCNQIIKAHQGEIRCDSQRGVGSTFTIVLPAAGRS